MAKNRQTLPTMTEDITGTIFSNTENTYTTSTGAKIDLEGHTEEFFKHMENDIQAWIKYASASPAFLLTKDELQYVLNHMTNSTGDDTIPSGYLTRVEKARHFQKHNYKVGDTIEDPSEFRSYSRTQSGTLEYIKRNGNPDRSIVIYRTHGNVKHFDASKYDDTYGWETESFVEQNKMKITGIKELKGETLTTLPQELGLTTDVSTLEKPLPYSITIVDVEQVNT